jgi:hypothetical protein
MRTSRLAVNRIILAVDVQGFGDHDVPAGAVSLTFRLLDAPALKAALAESPGVLAVIAGPTHR